MNIYEQCPTVSGRGFTLRFVSEQDRDDLLRVYADSAAVPFFNSDNCHGDDFHYTTDQRMLEGIRFWIWSYENGYFVRWSVLDDCAARAIGTVELFIRISEDIYNGCGVLRVDLRSDYERENCVTDILSLLLPAAFDWLGCNRIITKAKPFAAERIKALKKLGFVPGKDPLLGHDGTAYGDYWICTL